MELKKIFDAWASSVKPDYTQKQWLLSKWELFEKIEWPQEKRDLLIRNLETGLGLKSDDNFIELGCGGGWILKELKKKVRLGYGLDFSLEMLKHAQAILPPGMLLCADITALPLQEETFSKILCYYVIINFSDDKLIEQTILGIWKLLKKSGRALIGQLPDATKSHLYDEAKNDYSKHYQQTQDLGKNNAEFFPPPLRLFDREKIEQFLQKQSVVYRLTKSFNPFYYKGQPESVDWRFDIVLEKK